MQVLVAAWLLVNPERVMPVLAKSLAITLVWGRVVQGTAAVMLAANP